MIGRSMRIDRKITDVCAVSLKEISFIVTFFRFSAIYHASPILRPDVAIFLRPRSHVHASPISRPHASPSPSRVPKRVPPRPHPTFSHSQKNPNILVRSHHNSRLQAILHDQIFSNNSKFWEVIALDKIIQTAILTQTGKITAN